MRILSYYVSTIVLLGSIMAAAQASRARESLPQSPGPTPVSGDSWLTHLSRSFNQTSMGKTGLLGPATASEQEGQSAASVIAPPAAEIALTGADLYRLNCRGCHGAEGLGAPPEINSVINPVKGTSVQLVIERMKSRGLDISPSSANELAKEARASLLKRLHEGGQNMPSFSYLTEPEIASIVVYLNQLAQVPGAARTAKLVRESPERVGELIIKSTCHICHAATGQNPTAQQLYEGQIPPLETLSSRVDQSKFIRKVTHGLPILMGEPAGFYRGRMPVFYYFTPEEAADAYLYLNYYPPVSRAQSSAVASTTPPPLALAIGATSAPNMEAQDRLLETHPNDGLSTSTLLAIAGLLGFVVMLIVGGFAFTIREFYRMSGRHEHKNIPNLIPSEQQPEDTPLVPTYR